MTLIAFVYVMLFSPAREQHHQQLNVTWFTQPIPCLSMKKIDSMFGQCLNALKLAEYFIKWHQNVKDHERLSAPWFGFIRHVEYATYDRCDAIPAQIAYSSTNRPQFVYLL